LPPGKPPILSEALKPQNQLDLAGFVAIIRRRKWLVIAIAIGTAVLAAGFSLLQADRYEANADLQFRQDERTPPVNPAEPLPDPVISPERIAATNLALASLDKVTARVKQRLNSSLSIHELRDQVTLKPQGQADIVRITAEGPSAREAARRANAFAEEVAAIRREDSQEKVQRVIDAIDAQLAGVPPGSADEQQLRRRQDQLRVEKRLRTGDVEIVQPAIPPSQRSSPKPLRNSVIGFVLGLILGMVVALLSQRFDRRVESEDELPDIVGAPVIARVPVERSSGWERELFVESFQFLRANLELRDPDSQLRTIAVTSPLPGNGKSTIVAWLADAMALSGSKVIVVDCDLRRPTLHHYYGVTAREGLTSALVGLRDPVDMLRQTAIPSIRLLPAGPLVPLPASVLAGSKGMSRVLARLSSEADYVIVDTSPVTIGADTSAIAASVDATVLVVDLATGRRDVLAAASAQLQGAHANIVGVVVNRAQTILKDHAYKGYYGNSGRSLFNEEAGFEPAAPIEEPYPPEVTDEPDEVTLRREEGRRASGSQR
jgi:polysaccharide biosynthesis transport protein